MPRTFSLPCRHHLKVISYFIYADLDSYIFHAGTAIGPTGHIVTAGGRVIGVTATAVDLKSAVAQAYEAMNSVNFSPMHFRKDIAYR
jgi:phosphoribosylamine-glycine ligase